MNKKILINPNRSTDWITPPEFVRCYGEFDLDPCASPAQPEHNLGYHAKENNIFSKTNICGLEMFWEGRVWLNPPYGREICQWVEKMSLHRNGLLLCPARTDTKWFNSFIFQRAHTILFVRGRIKFYGSNGHNKNACPFPVCLASYCQADSYSLIKNRDKGHMVSLR